MIRPTRKSRAAVPLTEARARLFPLVDDLVAGRTDRVALSRRGHDEEVLLVRARDVLPAGDPRPGDRHRHRRRAPVVTGPPHARP